ncbi:haloacid dehalogenase-like hydrolase domain-containing protein 3 isoform X2 [Haliotis asinina]|uniref:haloacid dehalogenase-like hydrolase domain-containing protein 3 isoform X2 n=1 Tax=Haliotis asinina TaxID=109174 RepID=UPI00353203EB
MLEHDFVDICEGWTMSRFRLVTLDVTNTLLKISGSPGHQYAAVASIYGVKAKVSDINTSFKYRYRQYSEKYPNFGSAVGMSSYKWWTDLVKDCFKSVADASVNSQVLPTTNQDETLTQIANHLYLHFSTAKAWEILPGAEDLLQSLKADGVMIGAISNFDGRLEKILSCLALRHYFDFVTASAKVGYEKPDRRIFEHALALSKIPASESVHIGDSYEKDYLGAVNVGMTGYLVHKGNEPLKNIDPKFVVQELGELPECLRVRTMSTEL